MKQTTRRKKLTFAFCLRCCLTWLLALAMITQSATIPAARAANPKTLPPSSSPKEPPATPPAPQGNVDLTVTALNTAAVVTDSQTLIISGDLGVTLQNYGADPINAQFRVIAFEDRNGDRRFDQGVDALLGETNFLNGLNANGSAMLNLVLSGVVSFKGNLIYVLADSENRVAEVDEMNNLFNTGLYSSGTNTTAETVVIPYGDRGYKYKIVAFGQEAGFERPEFDDSSFSIGDAGFGNACGNLLTRTPWPINTDLLLRKKFDLPSFVQSLEVSVAVDNDAQVFVNGNDISNGLRVIEGCAFRNRLTFTATSNILTVGENLIAVRGRDRGVTDYLDLQVKVIISPTPDLTASFIRKNDAQFPTSTELTARIGNGGGTPVPPAVKISFYSGDPASGGTLIGTTQTSISLNPGQYEDVKVIWTSPPLGLHPITVVADDNGSGQGTVNEGNENNNKASANIALGIGPFMLVDDLIARFKDGAVDLKWSPIAGAASYNIYRRTGNGSAQLIKQAHPRANFADSGLTNGTTYYYTVRWVNANGIESGDGTEMSATPTSQSSRNDVPPTILSAPVTRAVTNTPYSYDAGARDPNAADSLSYQLATPLPESLQGMTINSGAGLIQWTPTFAGAGYQNVTVRVTDSRGRFAVQTYRLFVEIPNSPPLANAGPDQTIMAGQTANLNGAVLDDGLPFGGTLTTAWTKVSGPGAVVFANPSQPVTTATFSELGTYVLRLSVSDSQLSGSDEVTINVVRQFASYIYTLNADFDQGALNNVDHRIPNQLQLSDRAQPFNFIWVAVSTKGTAVKINTDTGQIMGEFWTSPDGQPKNPSRTTVDLNGNVWMTNRDGNSVTRIGLVENGQCIDRNGNGRIDTSTAQNDIKPWTNAGGADTNGGVATAQDECIINYVRVSSPGTRHVSVNKDNDVWVSGTGNRIFDLIDGVTGLIKRTEGPVGHGGYGGLIDKNGVIWSTLNGNDSLLRWDTSKPLSGPAGGNWTIYSGYNSYGLGIDGQGNVWNSEYGNNTRKYAPDGTILGAFNHGRGTAQGVAVDKNGHVWVAHSLNDGANTVGHLKNDGTFIGNVTVGSGPTGVAVDTKGKVWATNYHSRTVSEGVCKFGEISRSYGL